jgi:hypothetical protein
MRFGVRLTSCSRIASRLGSITQEKAQKMLIDNAKFLALVTALSAASAGCLIVGNDGSDSDGIGGFSDGGFNEGGSTFNASGGFGEGGSCLDDIGSPADCVSDCEGYTNCEGIHYFKDGVAEQLVDCLNALDPSTCIFLDDVINTCALTAMEASCIDETASFTCDEIATDCGSINDEAWQGQCGAYVDGLNDLGRAFFGDCAATACVDEGLTPTEALESCLLGLFP